MKRPSTIIVLLLAGLLAFGVWNRGPEAPPPGPGVAPADGPAVAAAAEEFAEPGDPVDRSRVEASAPRRAWEEDARAVPEGARVAANDVGFPTEPFRPAAYDQARMAIFGGFWREAEAGWDAGRFALAEADAETLTGRESYQAYVYLRTCLNAPRTATQVDRFLEQLDRAASGELGERQLQRVQRVLDRVEDGVVRCEGLPQDLEPLAIDWLTRAATRGYPLAQIAFYRSYRWLAGRKPYLLFGDQEAIWKYRRLAPPLLEAALRSGHPEAFVEMGQALADGIVFREDLTMAYAHAVAADLAADGRLAVGAELRGDLEARLTEEERREGREQARALCDRYCL